MNQSSGHVNDARQAMNSNSSDYFRKRLQGFSVTLIVMGLSFLLYYLGMFGGVDGPLNPEKISSTLNTSGFTRMHLSVITGLIALAAVTWNWVFNLFNYFSGTNLTCNKKMTGGKKLCGENVVKTKTRQRKTGVKIDQYVCPKGHVLSTANFNPLKKGTLGHVVWISSLMLFLTVMYC